MPLALILLSAAFLLSGSGLFAAVESNLQYNFYRSDAGVVDTTPAFELAADLGARTRLQMQYSLDAVSAASFNYSQSKTHQGKRGPGTCFTCHPPSDTLSGASKNYAELRHGLNVGVRRKNDAIGWGADLTISRENDYSSDGMSLSWLGDSGLRNTTLGLGVQYSVDRIGSVTRSLDETLTTQGADLSLTQILSPSTVTSLGFSYGSYEGYQQNPYAFVQIGSADNPIRVNQPRRRERRVATASYKQGLTQGLASQTDYRYYADDWGVSSHTLELTLSQRLGPLVIEPFYRRYWQPQGASFFKNFYDRQEEYLSRDLKLAAHETRLAGLTLKGKFGPISGLLSYSYFSREDKLDYRYYFADKPESASLIQAVLSYP